MNLKTDLRLIFFFILSTIFDHVKSTLLLDPLQNLAPIKNQHHLTSKALVPKVSLTQKGYIQFLRYVVDVPELTEYTFCIWVRSHNFTHNHPLLSYSKDEKERLLRVWISPAGRHLNLEILEVPIFSVPVNLVENVWYHVCQSWSSYLGAWSFYLNGKLRAKGYASKLKKVPIKSGGDIVVGQEYTDFDKGLDDGIEGDISGFNFVLASTFNNFNSKQHLKVLLPPPNNLFKRETSNQKTIEQDPIFSQDQNSRTAIKPNEQHKQKSHSRRQIWDESLEYFSMQKLHPPLPLEIQEPQYQTHAKKGQPFTNYQQPTRFLDTPVELAYKPQTKIVQDVVDYPQQSHLRLDFSEKLLNRRNNNRDQSFTGYLQKPLGLLLVELSNDCSYLRGAPLSGKGVLVSWTKTNVRVFGGAILKSVHPFCSK